MLENISEDLKLKSLLGFVKVLIKNSRNTEIFRLKEILKENEFPIQELEILSKEEMKKKIKEEVKAKFENPKKNEIKKEFFDEKSFSTPFKKKRQNRIDFSVRRVLRIPKINLPSYLSSIKPVPSNKISIDLGKLNPFIQDPNVSSIETEGENEVVYVNGKMGRKPTNLKLSKIEIEEVINRFSESSKIPKKEGLFRVAVGKLLLTATISESVSSRFIIEKIKQNKI